MTQNIKNQCIFVSTQIRYNDGMFFYEQQEHNALISVEVMVLSMVSGT